MVLRIWRGWTTPANADAYERIVSTQVLPGIAAREVPGYHGAFLLRRPTAAGEVEFMTIMHFDSLDAVRAFAGADHEAAYVPPAARAVLKRFDERSAHYDVLMAPELRAGA
jgi:heme-degrading monooxygenase HmoA